MGFGNTMKIFISQIHCSKCGDEIESYSVHDFKFYKYGAVAADGGHEYLKRCGNFEDGIELSNCSKVGDETSKY